MLAAGESGTDALAQLCSMYWYPIFAFVRRKGHTVDEAQDLTQGFFARLIEKQDLADADRTRGRFRTFLLTACQHFLSNERDRTRALMRGGGALPVSIDAVIAEGRYVSSLADKETPERAYERQWCITLLEAVLQDLQKEYEEAGNGHVFHRLKQFLTSEEEGGTHSQAAQDLGMNASAVRVAVHRLRRRYGEALRRRVADTVEPAEVEDEIRHLFKTLIS